MINYPNVDLNKLPQPYQGDGYKPQASSFTGTPSGSTSSDYSRMLAPKERKELEVPMSLYVNIKLLNSIENLYSREYITRDQYNDKLGQILERIENLENILKVAKPGFSIESFIEEYSLQDCIFAKAKIAQIKKGGAGGNENQKLYLIMSITANFIKIGDMYYMNNEQYAVKDILGSLQQMSLEMTQLKKCFTKEFNLGAKYQTLLNKYNQRDISDNLSKEESKEVFDVNSYAQNEFQWVLKQ